MIKYIIKRLLQSIPLLILITVICFILINIAPYDAVDAITTPNMKQEEIDARREEYGLDKPIITQYTSWVKNFVKGDFGYSIITRTSIKHDLVERVPATVALILPAYLISYFISTVLGLISGSNKGKRLDKMIDGICSIGIAVPTFWFAMIVIYLFAYKLRILPLMGMYSMGKEGNFIDYLYHLILPTMVLIVGYVPDITRYVRNSTIIQMNEEYVLVQKAFGASKSEILLKHVAKNVLLPIVTKMGMSLPLLITGAVITETIFSWPGMGNYFVTAIQNMDYPVIMAVLVLSGSLTIIGNLLSDIMYGLIDPRIRYRGQ
ncbi:ABC transporter permease [Miniphocaeibacter massiliensis]|uniref:ABC transporter permease n=1 Tax=Miniphocaeibacter massiliensis TaxID=2041841 RepID=UPI000C1BED0E|nr:ABC transporter permease [Miniphocaeibacter massiliensis]